MSRLSRLAVSKRSVTLLLAAALFIAGVSAWGSLKQELLPDIEFPFITVVATYPGAGSSDVAEQVTKPIENAISGVPRLDNLQSTSSNSIALVVAQFTYGTNVKEATAADPGEHRQGRSAGVGHADRLGPEHQLDTGRRLVHRGHERGRPGQGRDDRPNRDRPGDRRHRRRRQGRPGGRSRGAPCGHPRPGQARGVRRLHAADRRHPAGEQPDPAVRPAVVGRLADAGLDDRHGSRRSRRSRASSSATRRHRSRSRRSRPSPARPPAPTTAPFVPQPDHPRLARHGRDRRGRHDRLRSHQRQPVAQPHGLQDRRRQHGRCRAGGPGQAAPRSAAQHVGGPDHHDRRGRVHLHHRVARRPRPRRWPRAPSSRSWSSSGSC